MRPSLDPTTTVAKIVLDHPECARIFRAHRIDFCCRGDVSVAAACAEKRTELGTVMRELAEVVAQRTQPAARVDPRKLSTADLLDRIVARHHAYLRQSLPFLDELARKVARVHGDREPKLRDLAGAVAELREELEPHIDEEERTLFPALTAAEGDANAARERLGAMRSEHERVGELLATMRAAADDYRAPDWACRSYRALIGGLEALEEDTLEHVHVENHVLAPRFVEGAR